jgi:hypothetical protein
MSFGTDTNTLLVAETGIGDFQSVKFADPEGRDWMIRLEMRLRQQFVE